MEKFILAFLDVFKPMFEWAGVDYPQLRSILSVKIKIDNRRQTVRFNKNNNEESNNTFLWMLIIYCILGAFVGLAIMASQFMFGITIFFSYLMAMMAITLITDFSSILLDTSDNTIILPRPVHSKTFYVARLMHILLYLGQLAISLSLIPCVFIVYKYGPVLLLPTLVAIALATFIAVFITNGVYLSIMRFANEQKLKNIINYFQITMAIVLMGGYQILPRLIGKFDYQNTTFEIHWWSYLIPPLWLSGSLDAIHVGQLDMPHVAFILLSVVTPFLCIYATTKWLTPFYNKKLLTMNAAGEINNSNKKENQKTLFEINKVAAWFTTSHYEKGALTLVYKMLGRDNKLKLKIYPSFGFIFVFGLIFFVSSKKAVSVIWEELPTTSLYLFFIYAPIMVVSAALREISFTDDFKASWIYLSTPLQRPGEILLGTVKAVFVKLFIPSYFFSSLAIIFVWGPSSVDDIVFGFFNNFLITIIMASIGDRYLPLSVPTNALAQAGNLLRGLLTFICMGIPIAIHYMLSEAPWPFVLIISIPIQFLLIYFLVKNYKNTRWAQIKI